MEHFVEHLILASMFHDWAFILPKIINMNNNKTNEQVTVNDIKSIEEYSAIPDEEAMQIVNNIKQIAHILCEYEMTVKNFNLTPTYFNEHEYQQAA